MTYKLWLVTDILQELSGWDLWFCKPDPIPPVGAYELKIIDAYNLQSL